MRRVTMAAPSTSKAKRLGRGKALRPEKKADAPSDVLERTVTSQLKGWTNEIVRVMWMRYHGLSKACAWPLLQCMRAGEVHTLAMQCACRLKQAARLYFPSRAYSMRRLSARTTQTPTLRGLLA
ncbi:hypothetical protein HaLaN_30233, partial [Haematococcus lacustris]